MILRRIRLFIKDQRGILLPEMLASLAIVAIIALGVSIASTQVMSQTARNSDYTTASRHTLNAIQWISRDTQMAQTIAGADGFPATDDLVLTWTGWDNSEHEVTYSVVNGRVIRSYSVDGGPPSVTVVAEYINSDMAMTNCVSDNGVLTLTITSSVGVGSKITDVTKMREITRRPKL
jgi:type II secretory pathway pseudopilin PulG